MSRPAVIPADVHTWPSAIKIRSTSTEAFGKRLCSSFAKSQCVVALRPSSKPASPKMNAPVQIDARRRVLASAPCKKKISSADGGLTLGGEPISSVSKSESAARSVSISIPNELLMPPPLPTPHGLHTRVCRESGSRSRTPEAVRNSSLQSRVAREALRVEWRPPYHLRTPKAAGQKAAQ